MRTCCDFPLYYDHSAPKLNSFESFTGTTDRDATVNPDLPGQVKYVWSNVKKTQNYSEKRSFMSASFTAKKDATTHISYFMRDLGYQTDTDVLEIDQYQFTCDVEINGSPVVQNALPELNVDKPQTIGKFENSRSGNSADSDEALTGKSIKANGGAKDDISAYENNNYVNRSADSVDTITGNNPDKAPVVNGGSSGNNSDKKDASEGSKTNPSDANKAQTASEGAKADDGNKGKADAAGNAAVSTADSETKAKDKDNGGSSPVMWIIIIAVVLIAAGCIGYVVVKGKKKDAPKSDGE